MREFIYEWERFWSPHNVEIHHQGFLPDPQLIFGDKRLVTFEEIQDVSCLILLGDPGTGKSFAIQRIAQTTIVGGELCIFEKLNEYDDSEKLITQIERNDVFKTWCDGEHKLHLFLDSLDEGRREAKTLEHDLQHYFQTLPFQRLNVRITCRAAELPTDFLKLMRDIWSPHHDLDLTRVMTYHLAPLREKDVLQAAQQRSVAGMLPSPERFLAEVRAAHIEPLAAHPITLDMLFRIYEAEGQLPATRAEAYERGCRLLAKENNKNRQDDNFVGEFDVDERLNAALNIAAVTILGNKTRITSADNPPFNVNIASLEECYLPEHSSWKKPSRLLQETLRTALFSSSHHQTYLWAHRSYGEYLASEFIRQSNLSLDQIKSIFVNPFDPESRIALKLQETASWLASRNPDVFAWLYETEPAILVGSTMVPLTNHQKEALVEHFILHYATQEVISERLQWSERSRLCHPTLDTQLRQYLRDKELSVEARHLALDIAFACDLTSMDDIFVELILDKDNHLQLRKSSLAILAYSKRSASHLDSLRELVFQPDRYEVDKEMVAYALDILYPEHISTDELFSRLPLPTREEYSLSSVENHLLMGDLVERIAENDLPITLEWIAQNDSSIHHIPVSIDNFIQKLLHRSWKYLSDEKIRFTFARAAWQRLINSNSILLPRDVFGRSDPLEIEELQLDTECRRQLLQAMLTVLSPEGLRNTQLLSYLVWERENIFWVKEDDIPWLIDQAHKADSADKRSAYIYLGHSLSNPKLHTMPLAIAEWLYEQHEAGDTIVHSHFSNLFESIALGSDLAIEARRRTLQYRTQEAARQAKQREHDIKRRDGILKWLSKSEEDSANWWVLSSRFLDHWHSTDIRLSHGWQLVSSNEEIVERIIQVAHRYIAEQSPYIADVKEHDELWEQLSPAREGYRALILLGHTHRLDLLRDDDWARWATAIVFNAPKEDDTKVIDDLLLLQASEHASEALMTRLGEVIEKGHAEYYLSTFLHRCRYIPADLLRHMLIEQLNHLIPGGESYYDLLSFLLQQPEPASHMAEVIATQHLAEICGDENSRAVCKRILHILSMSAQSDSWWSLAWNLLNADRDFAVDALGSLGDWHGSPFFRYLTDVELRDLYLLAADVYRFDEDIEFHGGGVPPRHKQQEWRDSIVQELARRGTQEAINFIETIRIQLPSAPNVDYQLEVAHAQFRYQSWVALDSASILRLAVDHKHRLPRTAEQLLEVVVATLGEIERNFRGKASMKEAVWHWQANDSHQEIYRPSRNEEAFSDVMASWLREYLQPIIINREAHVEILPQSDERTDIQVETLSDAGQPLIVIIEVKCCWYRDICEPMQTQLVDKYLANHPRCSQGIYLVGYFASEKWDSNDTNRLNLCSRRGKSELLQELTTKAGSLQCAKPIVVKPYVFDASM